MYSYEDTGSTRLFGFLSGQHITLTTRHCKRSSQVMSHLDALPFYYRQTPRDDDLEAGVSSTATP